MPLGLGKRESEENVGLRVLVAMAAFVVVVGGLRAATELFIPVMLGLFMAILSLPSVNWLDQRGLPRALAIAVTVVMDFLVLFSLLILASTVIPEFQSKGADYAKAMQDRAASIAVTVDDKVESVRKLFETSSGEKTEGEEEEAATEDLPGAQIPSFNEFLNRYWDSRVIIEWIGQAELVGRMTSVASKSFFVLIIMIFILAESDRYARKVKEVIRVRGPDLRRFQNSSRDIQKFLAIKTLASAVTGLLAYASCVLLRVDFPILWGLIAFVFNYVPAIGSIMASIPPVLLALIQSGFWPAMAVLACYLVINMGIGNFIEPMLLGERFGISTVVVILSVLFWGFVWGPVGMFLAVPLTMVVKVMLDTSPDFRWISVMLSKAGEGGMPQRRRSRARLPVPDSVAAPAAGGEGSEGLGQA